MSTTLEAKVRGRLAQLGRNPFEAARKGGLERSFVNDILIGKKKSVQGANLGKLAVGLDWTVNDIINAGAPPTPDEKLLYIGQLRDNDSIQVEVGLLRSLIAEALSDEGLPPEEALAYADGVLGSLRGRQVENVVVRLGGAARIDPESQAPMPDGPS